MTTPLMSQRTWTNVGRQMCTRVNLSHCFDDLQLDLTENKRLEPRLHLRLLTSDTMTQMTWLCSFYVFSLLPPPLFWLAVSISLVQKWCVGNIFLIKRKLRNKLEWLSVEHIPLLWPYSPLLYSLIGHKYAWFYSQRSMNYSLKKWLSNTALC